MDLYVSDLDGTLLNSSQVLSGETVSIINGLIDNGLYFTIATARSIHSAGKIIAPLKLRLPIVVHNGVYIYDPVTETNIVSNFIPRETAEKLVEMYMAAGISPIVFAVDDKGESKVYYRGIFNPYEECYIHQRFENGDKRFELIDDFNQASCRDYVEVLAISEEHTLGGFYKELKKDCSLSFHFAEDIYSGGYWLEAAHRNATKKAGVAYLARYLNAGKLVCFGDHLNDCPMFEIADECYAVSNAHDDLKKLATGIIAHHNEDAVARFLQTVYKATVKE